MFKNKVLMITGGTGSFGNAVLEKFIKTDLDEIRIFSRDENKQDEQRQKINNPKIKYYIGDVRDRDSLKSAMKGVNLIFHAAALKQVPSCEFYPLEALNTNVIGANNVISEAIDNKVGHTILLSTDKAVYPVNAMGITKSLMEKVMIARSREIKNSKIKISATRYGNVMASRGSVIPLWIKQIENEERLTITNPKMSRFLMSLDDSIDLVIHSYKYANSGEIFVQKSPSSYIGDLAKAIKEIFKYKKNDNIIGMRHGEKLYETLVSSEEKSLCKETNSHFIIRSDDRDLNYKKYITQGKKSISKYSDYTSHNTNILSVDEIKNVLLKLPYIKGKL